MDPRILSLAEQVIQRSDAAHPADALLRGELRIQRRLSPELATETSRVVFAYFRWKGWLDAGKDLRRQLAQSLSLAAEFKANPRCFSDSDLVSRSVPTWLGEELECTPDWARTLQAEPKLWLRARPGQGRLLAQRLQDCRAFGGGLLADILQYCGKKDLFRTSEFHAGEFELQDLNSQAVGLSCAPEPGSTWWDACAGEGGKLLHLSDLMRNTGLIWATDRAEWRLRQLRRRAARAKVYNYRLRLWDGGVKLPTKTTFDGVLIDAPCAGIGTWQRNPHARWTLARQDIPRLAQLQLQLLGNAAAAVKPGGKLVYSVCSLTRAETTNVAQAFDSAFPDFTPFPIRNPLAPATTPASRLLIWPQQFGGNGMFITVWRRRGA